MSIGTLYVGSPQQGTGLRVRRSPPSPFLPPGCLLDVRSVQIKAVAAIAGLTLDEPSDYVHFTTNKTPEFLAKFASGKVPAFEAKDGFTLFEGTAIARYREWDDLLCVDVCSSR